jgi:hypothetical protein
VKTVSANIASKPTSALGRDRMRRVEEPIVDADDAALHCHPMPAQAQRLNRALASSHQDAVATHQPASSSRAAAAQSPGLPVSIEYQRAHDTLDHPHWHVTALCLSAGLDPEAMRHLGQLLSRRIRFRKGETLYHVGTMANALIALQTGSCKTSLIARDGQEQICGYYLAGDVIGIQESEATFITAKQWRWRTSKLAGCGSNRWTLLRISAMYFGGT